MAKKSMIAKQKLTPKYKTRFYNRCKICGRPHAYIRKFGICRICGKGLCLECMEHDKEHGIYCKNNILCKQKVEQYDKKQKVSSIIMFLFRVLFIFIIISLFMSIFISK